MWEWKNKKNKQAQPRKGLGFRVEGAGLTGWGAGEVGVGRDE